MADDQVFNTKFIGVVEKYPCTSIYDYTRKDYSRKTIVEKAWKDIESEVKLPAVKCKERWKNLRTAFSRSLKSPRSGSGATRKTYYLEDVMQFVLSFMKAKIQSGNLPHVEETTETDLLDDDNNSEDRPNESSPSLSTDPNPSVDKIAPAKKLVVSALERKKATETPNKSSKKRPAATINEADQSFTEYVNWKKSKITVPGNSDPKLDFLKSLLPDLNKMNDYQLRQFKKRTLDTIDSILCDASQTTQSSSRPNSIISFIPEHQPPSHQEMQPQHIYPEISDTPTQRYLLNFTAELPDNTTSE
nr:unnamed protein product [Callosobruchus analis]